MGCRLEGWLARASAWRLTPGLSLSLSLRCTQLGDGKLERGSVLEGLVDRHHAISDGFELVRLPGVRQEQLLAMPVPGAGRDVKLGMSPEIQNRPATAAAPLAEGPQDAAAEQNIPFRDRRHVGRCFSQPGTGEQKPAKPVSPKASVRKAFGPRKQTLTETPPDGFEPSTGCLEGSCSIQLS